MDKKLTRVVKNTNSLIPFLLENMLLAPSQIQFLQNFIFRSPFVRAGNGQEIPYTF